MPTSPLPTPLQDLGARRFSFYPAILNVEHNEWQYRRATWSELVVVNTRSGEEAIIPRAFLGEVSIVDHPVVIVGLRRELEWRNGAVYPHQRPVIEFPVAVNDDSELPRRQPAKLAPVVNIRLEPPAATRKSTRAAVAVMLGAVACFIAAGIAREVQLRQRVRITWADNYSSIVGKLGAPAADRKVTSVRMLAYPARHLQVVLSDDGHYIGALDTNGRVADAVTLPNGSNSGPLLRSLPPF